MFFSLCDQIIYKWWGRMKLFVFYILIYIGNIERYGLYENYYSSSPHTQKKNKNNNLLLFFLLHLQLILSRLTQDWFLLHCPHTRVLMSENRRTESSLRHYRDWLGQWDGISVKSLEETSFICSRLCSVLPKISSICPTSENYCTEIWKPPAMRS